MQDIKWWQYIMPILNGTKSIYLDVFFEPGTLIDMDATLVGAGGGVQRLFLAHPIPTIYRPASSHHHPFGIVGLYFGTQGMAPSGQ